MLASKWSCRHPFGYTQPWTYRYNDRQLGMLWVGTLLHGAILAGCHCLIWTIHTILSCLRMSSTTLQTILYEKASTIAVFPQSQLYNSQSATTGYLHTASRTGPKSGRTHQCTKHALLLQLLCLAACMYPVQTVSADARVGGPSAMPPEVPFGTKPRGTREASVPKPEHSDNRISKRSYKRAYARAARQGGSHYKGQWRPFEWYQRAKLRPVYVPRTTPTADLSHHLRVLTWNAGGLTKPTFQELETFIRDHRLDVIFIQETKWTDEYCWHNHDYSYIHSAGSTKVDKVGGLLTIISTRVAKPTDIQFHHVWAGRLLHVRIPAGNTSLDLLNAYQFSANEKSETQTRRQQYLRCLQRCLAGLPRRHSLILSGDLNTSCEPTPHVCGRHVLPIGEYHKQDYRDFLHICEALSLTVLNSWTRPLHRQLATFRFGALSSQIDFIIVRQAQADNEARKASVLVDFPVAGWREGAKHFPVRADVPVPKRHWKTEACKPVQQVDLQGVIHDLQNAPQAQRLQDFRDTVEQKLSHTSDFDHVVLQAALQHYPKPPKPPAMPTQPAELANSARHMWHLFRQMRAQRFSMQGVFSAWKTWTKFTQAHRLHKQRAQGRAKARRDELLAQAQTAATTGDLYQMWSVVKRLAPKMKFRRVQLHKHGTIMAPEAEVEWIAQAFGDRYGAVHSAPPGPLHRIHSPVQVQVNDVKAALLQLPARKAVPPGAVPSAVWKACAEQIASPLTKAVNQAWSRTAITVQQSWADADVALLPKGSKQAKTPLDLRPIGLQHPLGKTMMKVLVMQAKDNIATLVKRWPQTAYVPGRGTTTALKVVLEHCKTIRTACAQVRLNLHQKHADQGNPGGYRTSNSFQGGLQVSLDLTAAFDMVRWDHVRGALELAAVDPSVQELLLQWLRQVVYTFNHRGRSQRVRPSWGLRQGCPASPVLWSVFTALLCQAFDARLGDGWAAEHVAMYADDSHLRWQFNTYLGFERAMTELRIVIRLFAAFDMQVNCTKTQAIMQLSGSEKHKIRKHYVRIHEQGHRLLLMAGDPTKWLPLVPQTEYLGLIISYDGFEARSVRHRIAKASQRRWALASILHSRKLAHKYKLQIWRSCVQSTLTYGLHCFELSSNLLAELNVASMKHIRAIVSDQQHLTGRTHQEIMEQYHITPLLDVTKQAHNRELKLLAHDDWMLSTSWHQCITTCLNQVQVNPIPMETDSEQERWACPECDEMFTTAAALKIHAQRTHGIKTEQRQIFDRARHSVGGLPTCKFCTKQFSRWQTLGQHINTLACPVFQPDLTANEFAPQASEIESVAHLVTTEDSPIQLPTADNIDAPAVASPETAQKLARQGLRFFIPYKKLGRHLQQHCILCGQWVASSRVMKLHFRNTHPDIFPVLEHKLNSLIERCATPSLRCHYCDGTHQDWRAHVRKCTTVWQLSVLCTLQDPDHAIRGHGPRNGGVLRHGQASAALSNNDSGERQASARVGAESRQVDGLGPGALELPRQIPRPSSPRQRPLSAFLGKACATSRRGTATSPARHNSSVVVQPGAGLGVAALVSDSGCLQEKTTDGAHLGPGTCASQAGHGHGNVSGHPGTASAGDPKPGTVEEGHGHGMARRSGMVLPNLEPTAETPGTGPQQTPGVGCGHDQQTRVFPHPPQKGRGSSFPLHPSSHGNHGLQGHFSHGQFGTSMPRRYGTL